jgi:hypothetical protein
MNCSPGALAREFLPSPFLFEKVLVQGFPKNFADQCDPLQTSRY